jgi:exopolyphosphatase / guanosine-5'-triphosphate,3'-diphosphate pyrophosphatase
MKFAAIDIGSNAVRLLFTHVHEIDGKPVFRKSSLFRLPIRLGEDVFKEKKISERNILRLTKAMLAFRNLIEVHEVESYRACATSAMREAQNGEEVVEYILKNAQVKIDIIGGQEEADIIYNTGIAEMLDANNAYLYIDVGGGSTELSVFYNQEKINSFSFNIGTLRILNNTVTKGEWNDFKNWIKTNLKGFETVIGIGSGGNINKIRKLAKTKDGKSLSYRKVLEIDHFLKQYSYDDRVKVLGLNPDRADVIIPASKIFLTTMKTANINEIIVPQMGLSDGIVRKLYSDTLK